MFGIAAPALGPKRHIGVDQRRGGRSAGRGAARRHDRRRARTDRNALFSAITDGDGRFFISSVRVGGPYTVTATLSGFRSQEQANVTVPLGETISLDFKLPLATVAETITVEAEVDPVINPSRTGPAANVSTEQLENLPTVSRSLEDFARTSPYFSPIAVNAEPGALSVAGRNNRYNSIQIDGAVNNDLFGLSATGAPAGQTESQPISIDAIEELQLLVAPYDVRQGGFSGGGLNAVTKSGTNALTAPRITWAVPKISWATTPTRSPGTSRFPTARSARRSAAAASAVRFASNKRVLLRQLRDEPARRSVRLFGRRQLGRRLRPRGRSQPHPEHR